MCALQETRFTDEYHFNRKLYYIQGQTIDTEEETSSRLFGTGFAVHRTITDAVIDFKSLNERISTLTIKSANRAYTIINVHAPTPP